MCAGSIRSRASSSGRRRISKGENFWASRRPYPRLGAPAIARKQKESMLKSYRFDARAVVLQEVGRARKKSHSTWWSRRRTRCRSRSPRLCRETEARDASDPRHDVAVDRRGCLGRPGLSRVGTGPKGTLKIPPDIAKHFPAVLQLRVTGMNANGRCTRPTDLAAYPVILAIDTTHEFGSIALQPMVIAGRTASACRRWFRAHPVCPSFRHIGSPRAPLQDIECFAAASGPGSFTGVARGVGLA